MARPRRLLPLLLCLIVLSMTLARATYAQEIPTKWQALSGPGGRITQLTGSEDGRTVYLVSTVEVNRIGDQTQWRDAGAPASSDALYRSTDGGATWAPATNDLPPGAITEIYVDHKDDSVWIGLQERTDGTPPRSGPWRSVDEGHTWQRVRLDRDDLLVRSVARDMQGELLVAAVSAEEAGSSYVYRSSDDGASWRKVELPRTGDSPDNVLSTLVVHPLDAQLLYAVTVGGDLLSSGDGGNTWFCDADAFTCAATRQTSQLVIEPDAGHALMLLGARSGAWSVLRSTDDGKTWAEVRARGLPEVQPGVFAATALGNGVILANTLGGTYRSVDRGATWQPLEGALSSGPAQEFVLLRNASNNRSVVLAATGHGLFASPDAGALWRTHGTGLPHNSTVAGLLTHPNQPDLIVALTRSKGRSPNVLMSRDAGQTWLPGDGGITTEGATAWASDASNDQGMVLAGWEHISTTSDGGLTWKTKLLPLGQRTAIAIAPSAPQHIYVDGIPGLRSTDGGETWLPMNIGSTQADQPNEVQGIAVHPADEQRVWAGAHNGVLESRDGGASWQTFGLDGQQVRWLAATGAQDNAASPLTLFAGVVNGGVMRWSGDTQDWQPANTGLPASSNVIAFVADRRSPGLLWAARDGGGIYRSTDNGDSWQNVGIGVGDNLGMGLAVNYAIPGGIFMGTATAGVWALGAEGPMPVATQTPPGAPTSTPNGQARRAGVDARIEVVWPHDYAPLDQAQLANVGIRLFMPESLQPPDCGWRPKVRVWRAVNTEPALPVDEAEQRTVDGQAFPYWEANDVDVSQARDSASKVYFLVQIEGIDTATSVWAHASDARTYFPEQLVPSGVAAGAVEAVDARIQIVWPHDAQGAQKGVSEAALANVVVTLFKHGTRLSVPRNWTPTGITLYGAWNAEVARPLATRATVNTRQSGAITYPAWEFNDVPVGRAADPANRLYLWAEAQGVQSYPTIWAHGLDSRTFFPTKDEPIQGCLP